MVEFEKLSDITQNCFSSIHPFFFMGKFSQAEAYVFYFSEHLGKRHLLFSMFI